MTDRNLKREGEEQCVDIMATPFFTLGYRHGFHDRPWPRSYERWPFKGQINYERGRQFACYCLAKEIYTPLKRRGIVPREIGILLGLAHRRGYVTR